MQGSSMVPYLPLEVITQILEKLSVKTLLKFKVVCKLWFSLISSDQFVRRHLSLCSTQRTIMDSPGWLYDLGFYSVQGSIVLDETSIYIRTGGYNRFSVKGSCDGLVCLEDGSTGTMLLLNPSTRDFKVLPRPQVEGVHVKEHHHQWRRYGFGYDYKSDDYKVLILLPIFDPSKGYESIIYTLRSNSWKRIQDSPPCIAVHNNPSAFASGSLHWTVSKNDCIGTIVAFDLSSETYKEVTLPRPDIKSYHAQQLGASRGCLCLLTNVNHGYSDIWVMKKYGVPESWNKTVTIPVKLGFEDVWDVKPLTWFVENGEILLYANEKPVSYNANKNSFVYFASDVKISRYTRGSVGYEESLVSPNAYNKLGAKEICPLSITIVMRKV